MYSMFRRLKSRAMLLCTEVASRGLDFGNVDWVINFDVPADCKAYIHRVGRAARLGQRGNAITLLTPNEVAFVSELKAQNIECRKLGVHSKHLKPIRGAFQTLLAKDERMMDLAKKSFNSYLAFYYFHGNPRYMDPERLDKDALAKMFGLVATPKYKRFLRKCKSHRLSNMPSELKRLLLDNKKKRKQKSKLIALAAEKRILEQQRKGDGGGDGDEEGQRAEGGPPLFEEAFKDRRVADSKRDEEDVGKWLQSESDGDGDGGAPRGNAQDIERQALAAILDRD